MIGKVNYKDINELQNLWKAVFKDSDAFLDCFFQNLFRPEECFVTRTDGRLTSMLYLIDAIWSDAKADYPMRYVYACATHPDYRRQRLMGHLLETAIAYADKKRMNLVLVPANAPLFDYYKRFGFTQTIYLHRCSYPPLNTSKSATLWQRVQTDIDDAVKLLQTLRTRFLKGKNAVLWPDIYLKTTLKNIYLESGELLILNNNNLPPFGYALSLPKGEKVEIIECASMLTQDETVALLRSYYNEKATVFSLPPDGLSPSYPSLPFGLLYSRRTGKTPYLNLAMNY